MPKKPEPSRIRTVTVEDPGADEWHGKAMKAAAEARTQEEYLDTVPALPEWKGSEVVTRELLGRFLVDRDTHVVHDVENAVESCEIDRIRNGTFYHFWREVPGVEEDPHPTADPDPPLHPHPDCIPG